MFGVQSDFAMSGERAIELLGRRLQAAETTDTVFSPFKLVVCDFSMPGMSGPETTRRMIRLFAQF